MNLEYFLPFSFFIIGILILAVTFRKFVNKSSRKENTLEEILKKEQQVQFVRPKGLTPNQFLKVNLSAYPIVENEACQEHYNALQQYGQLPMVNFKQYTNLELKQLYGPQMLDTINQYETNYMTFIEESIAYGKSLYECGYIDQARVTLEQCLLYNCDVSLCYMLLIDIYKAQNDTIALNHLESIIKKEMQDSPFLNKVLSSL